MDAEDIDNGPTILIVFLRAVRIECVKVETAEDAATACDMLHDKDVPIVTPDVELCA